ncbi:putative lipase [Gordonia paraffinivorans NBRC 108238]|uniref:Lipase n=1 Tax=Gordonia paraffinivorans NBRC 108238 TaxID=1223543 RepID=A0ABQ0ISK0_9ACTN|nr:lipase family protein [Gordonia paraffinivorans]GAC85836.1 putative lipase [Gordonia paraffinivorans NBRC 108238]
MRARLTAAAIALTTVIGAALGSGTAAAVPVAPALPFPVPPAIPEFDQDFYLPSPATYVDKVPGELIAARRVHLAALSVIPINVDAWQISFRSTNTRGEPIPAVATVLKPKGPAKPGPSKLVSWQSAEDSTALYCAPSYALQQASIPGALTGSADSAYEVLQITSLVGAGWSVVIPDHQGPESAFAAGPLAGRITLDAIRGARDFSPLGLKRDLRVGLMGYSGGAIATGWAAELHESYAPELPIVGAAEGGVPADIRAMVDLANNNAASGLILAGIIGVSREYPELERFLRRHLNPLGKALLASKNPLCLTYQSALAPFLNIKGLVNLPGDPLDYPTPRKVLGQLKMGANVPDFPMFVYQSNPDWVSPVGPVNELVRTYCADPDASVRYVRDHFSEHVSLAIEGFAPAIVWMRDRLDGKPTGVGCTTADQGSMSLDPKTWRAFVNLVGNNLALLINQELGNPPRLP